LLSKAPYANDSVERARLVDHVLNFIVKMNMPLSIVDAKPFVSMISACNNKLKLPCRQTISNKLIPAKAAAAKKVLKEKLELIQFCSLTCDGWTSKGSHSYLGKHTNIFDYFLTKPELGI
jgi:hypothetical protein